MLSRWVSRRGWPLLVPLAMVVAAAPTAQAVAAEVSPEVWDFDEYYVPQADVESLTLVTGDRVTLTPVSAQRWTVEIKPAARAHGVEPDFELIEDGDDIYVLPSDAATLVPEQLDQELFNLTKLVDYGYTEGVPVIVTGAPGASLFAAAANMSATMSLPSVGGYAAKLSPDGSWWSGVAARERAGGVATQVADFDKVWLDEIAEVVLDESTPMVGAPQAWAEGFDGSGMTVAVLDTGIDEAHPDLAGRVVAAENFTTDSGTADEHGHGTHVAATVAGTGDGADGTYTGVAPGAQLLNGKICNASGSCPHSASIAGMEWAAQNADVVNLSIGSSSGDDGSAPTSQAVNQLSEQYDTLFVISAANNGSQGPGSIGSPGSADAALTVGSVDKGGALAPSSSVGPRLGDFAIKPDITAPGVGIVAARGQGTEMGTPVDDLYTSANGTSMAAPHVAGAAAILLQQYPDLSASEAKAALVATATPHSGLSVYEQGGGLVNVPAALDAPVVASPTPLNLGYFDYPHDDVEPVQAEVSYTNRTDEELTLDLDLDVSEAGGTVVPSSALSVSSETVAVPAGGQASVTVVLDAADLELGSYGGYLTASNGDSAVRVPVGFYKEDEMYTLTIEGILRDGGPATGPAGGSLRVQHAGDVGVYQETNVAFSEAGVATLRVPPGPYFVASMFTTFEDDGIVREDRTFVGSPAVEVYEDTDLTFDARQANELTFDTPAHPEAVPDDHTSATGYYFQSETGQISITTHTTARWVPTYVLGSEAPNVGEFEFFADVRLTDPSTPSYLYDLIISEQNGYPDDPSQVLHPDDLATVETSFHGEPGQQLGEYRASWRPYTRGSYVWPDEVPAASHRTEYLTADDTFHSQMVTAQAPSTAPMQEPDSSYEPGDQLERTWFKGPLRAGEPGAGALGVRIASIIRFAAVEWSDSNDPGNFGDSHAATDSQTLRVYRDGELLAEADQAQANVSNLSSDEHAYRFEVDVAREADWWPTSIASQTAWTVNSAASTELIKVLPFMMVDYDTELDLTNTAPHPSERRGPATLDLQVRHIDGADVAAIDRVSVEMSYDDGETWRQRPVQQLGDGSYSAILDQRAPGATSEFASVRVEAWDVDGNGIEQEVIRAWRMADR